MGPPPQAVGASTAGGSNGLVHERVGDVLEDAYIPERDRQDQRSRPAARFLSCPSASRTASGSTAAVAGSPQRSSAC